MSAPLPFTLGDFLFSDAAGPSHLEDGSLPYHLVNAGARKEGKILRPAVLVFSFLALMCVVAVVGSSRSARSALGQTGVSSEIPLSLMPDPAEAVHVAQETVDQVEPMHTHGAWIGESYYVAEVLSILFSCAAPPD